MVGNHEYNTSGAAPYFAYWGAAAGDPTKGYYSYDIGGWHAVVLNSNCSKVGGCGAGSAQEKWLKADLAASSAACTIAFWHHARFSSSRTSPDNLTLALWQDLYDAGAEIAVAGHYHNYERFAPQTPAGVADPATGIRQFVVGTGGTGLGGFKSTIMANSQVHERSTYGVLKLTLHASSYDFQFVPIAGQSFTDSGSGICHGRPVTDVARADDRRATASPTGEDETTRRGGARRVGSRGGRWVGSGQLDELRAPDQRVGRLLEQLGQVGARARRLRDADRSGRGRRSTCPGSRRRPSRSPSRRAGFVALTPCQAPDVSGQMMLLLPSRPKPIVKTSIPWLLAASRRGIRLGTVGAAARRDRRVVRLAVGHQDDALGHFRIGRPLCISS